MKKVLFFTVIFLIAMNTACSTATAPGANSNTLSNTNSANPANIPPEFSTVPVTPSGNSTPGIPDPKTANVNIMNKGATPTPGIPDPKTIGRTPVPKGATPTPGIPDPKTLKEQMNRTLNNVNKVTQIPKNEKQLEDSVDGMLKNVRKTKN